MGRLAVCLSVGLSNTVRSEVGSFFCFFFVIITIFFVERNPPLSSVEILVSEGRLHLSEVVGQFSSCTDGFIVFLRQ